MSDLSPDTQKPAAAGSLIPVEIIDDVPRVLDLDVGKRLGLDRPRKIRDLIARNIAEIEAFGVCPTVGQTPGEQGGRPATAYYLNEEQALLVATLSDAPRAPDVRRDLIRTFVAVRRGEIAASPPAVPNFSDPAAAARAWADQYEARVLAERTKAEIGSRREATAMATASRAREKAKRLEILLDRSTEWASIKRMEIVHKGRAFDWRVLKRVSAEVGFPPRDIPDPNFDTVKSYHASAWRQAYALEIADGAQA